MPSMEPAQKQNALADEAVEPAAGPAVMEAVRVRRPANSRLVRITPDRRHFHRVKIRLLGRFMRENRHEYPCQVVNMSPGDAAILTPVSGEIGERVVVYLDHIGRIEGEISRLLEGGFALRLQATSYKREKIANQLTWLINRDRLNLSEDRRYERLIPKNPFTKITLADGSVHNCRVLDVSFSGASAAISPKPPVGVKVVLGLMRGVVVRHHEHGIGIQFVDVQDMDAIRRHFG